MNGEGDLSWFKDAVTYQVFIDRFAGFPEGKPLQGNEFYGGNIKGIIDKFDHFKRLGVNTIWISPFYECTAYHGFHITNYFKVDPRFGTRGDLKKLIKKAHANGIRVIAGFVPNHVSSKHPYFLEAKKDKGSKYFDWFFFTKWPRKYVTYMGFDSLVKLNLDNVGARKHIIRAAKHWLKLGFDGLRLDYAVGPKHSFWQEFRSEIKKDFPNVVLIGETWFSGDEDAHPGIGVNRGEDGHVLSHSYDEVFHEYVGELDGVLDFQFQSQVNEHFAQGKFSDDQFRDFLIAHYSYFPKDFFLVNFLDNHDMDRFLFQCGGDKAKLKTAARAQLSTPQPSIIYYGTEIGMSHDRPQEGNGLWLVRQPMVWDESKWDLDLFEYYATLIRSAERGSLTRKLFRATQANRKKQELTLKKRSAASKKKASKKVKKATKKGMRKGLSKKRDSQ